MGLPSFCREANWGRIVRSALRQTCALTCGPPVGSNAAWGRIGASGLGCLETDCRNLSLLAALKLVAQPLTLLEVADAGALDRGDMNEHVLRAVVRLDEAVTLLGVEPFNGTDTHKVSSIEF